MKKYIDLSQFNAVTDWTKVASSVDGVILRAGYRGYGSAGTLVKDARFSSHLSGATGAGVPVGIYFLSQAITEAEAAAEADFVHQLIKKYKITLPVWFDSEWSHTPHTGRADTITAARRTDCALAFCARAHALGYQAGVYASESWFGSMMQLSRLSGVKIWCAKYSADKPSVRCDGWQYTDAGTMTGITGKVDVSRFGAAAELIAYAFPLSTIERIAYVPMAGTKGETVSAAALRTWTGRAPDVICNAELFSTATHKPASGVVCGGTAQLLTEAVGAALVDNKKPVLSYKNNVHAPDWLAGYPCLVRDGEVCATSVPAGLEGTVPRTALAWNATTCAVIRAVADLVDFAEAILDAGYTSAVNFDGGGSTAVVTPDAAYDQGRPVRGKLGVWLKGGSGNKLAREAAANSGTMQRDTTKTSGVTMTVTANGGLKLRKTAPDGELVSLLGKNTTVMWYGYFCIKDGVKWLYVRAASNKQGYATAEFLKEE